MSMRRRLRSEAAAQCLGGMLECWLSGGFQRGSSGLQGRCP